MLDWSFTKTEVKAPDFCVKTAADVRLTGSSVRGGVNWRLCVYNNRGLSHESRKDFECPAFVRPLSSVRPVRLKQHRVLDPARNTNHPLPKTTHARPMWRIEYRRTPFLGERLPRCRTVQIEMIDSHFSLHATTNFGPPSERVFLTGPRMTRNLPVRL